MFIVIYPVLIFSAGYYFRSHQLTAARDYRDNGFGLSENDSALYTRNDCPLRIAENINVGLNKICANKCRISYLGTLSNQGINSTYGLGSWRFENRIGDTTKCYLIEIAHQANRGCVPIRIDSDKSPISLVYLSLRYDLQPVDPNSYVNTIASTFTEFCALLQHSLDQETDNAWSP